MIVLNIDFQNRIQCKLNHRFHAIDVLNADAISTGDRKTLEKTLAMNDGKMLRICNWIHFFFVRIIAGFTCVSIEDSND